MGGRWFCAWISCIFRSAPLKALHLVPLHSSNPPPPPPSNPATPDLHPTQAGAPANTLAQPPKRRQNKHTLWGKGVTHRSHSYLTQIKSILITSAPFPALGTSKVLGCGADPGPRGLLQHRSGEKACPPGKDDCGKCSFFQRPDVPSIKAELMSSPSAASASNRTHPRRRPVRPPSDGEMPETSRHKALCDSVSHNGRSSHPKWGGTRLSFRWTIYRNPLISWI